MNKSVPTTTIPYLSEWYVIYTKSPRSLHPFDRTLTSGMVSNVAICYNCESVVFWTLSLCNIETVLMNSPLCAYSGETFSDVKVKLNTMLQVYML